MEARRHLLNLHFHPYRRRRSRWEPKARFCKSKIKERRSNLLNPIHQERKNEKTIKILITSSLFFTIFNCGYLTHAKSISNIEKVDNVIGLNIDLDSKIDMYNEKEEIDASYYSGTDKGYLIVNSNSCEPLEYSFENNIDFIEQNNGRYYYAGLLNDYKKSSKNILVDARNNTISFDKLKCKDFDNNFDISTFTKQQTRALTTISYIPRAYSYNPNGICSATAAAILLMYYDDHINVSYVPTAFESSGTGKKQYYMFLHI